MNEFINALKNKRARKEYLKSMFVGILATVLDFLITAIFLYVTCKEHYQNFLTVFTGASVGGEAYSPPISVYFTALVISFIVSILFNYLMSVFFVYEYGNVGKNKRGFIKFAIFAAIGLTITTVGSLLASNFFGLGGSNVWYIKIIITLIVFVFNFFTRKYFVFNIALIRDDDNTINL